MIFFMKRVEREKVYLTRRIREQATLTRRENGLSLIKFLEIILKISARITMKEHIFKIKNSKILPYQKAGIFLIILLKIMNIRNL